MSVDSCRSINVTRKSYAIRALEGFAGNGASVSLTRSVNTNHVLALIGWKHECVGIQMKKLRAASVWEHALGSFGTWEAHRVHELFVFFGNTTQAHRSPALGSWFPPGRAGQQLSKQETDISEQMTPVAVTTCLVFGMRGFSYSCCSCLALRPRRTQCFLYMLKHKACSFMFLVAMESVAAWIFSCNKVNQSPINFTAWGIKERFAS